jgi:ATP synthase protein I
MIIERSLRPVCEDREVGHLQRKLKGLGTYGTVGLEFGLSVLVGLFAGQWLDRKLHADPWLTFVGMGFGTAAGIRTLWRAAERARKELEDEEQREAQLRRDYHERNRKK